ncbi:response regulator [Kushneria indalinina]|uniref:Two-component system OmpR family response regulator n=1 Tax=Kushneria indalinina DSM 14324 TaxID=1122140 RepID=A0A3D9DXR6_9GAMM|nr:response regulator [Kushneria indalinina]REC95577.1 two-component system OmpR family response regulator [Kushneria indalinina DSM 14324]
MDCIGDVTDPAADAEQHHECPLVLVVDDDDEIRELITDYLAGMGYRTRPAANGREMWRQMDDSVDLVILDLMLPGEDGLSLCRDLCHQGGLPVIMISARGACAERIIGLEIGADDYLCKPFDPRELLARIRAVLRRKAPGRERQPPTPDATHGESARCFAGWRLDLQTRRLHSPKDRVLDLPRSDFMVLKALSEAPNRIVSRNTLSHRAFGREYYPDDRSIDVCISRLRHMLEDNARRPRFIRTIRNEGYLLELPSQPE